MEKQMFDLRVDNARLYPMAGDAQLAGARSFAVSNGRIVAYDVDGPAREVFDAQDRVVMPGLIDCHTHALYAGDRMQEHLLKLNGASYTDIAKAGGGIASSVRAVRAASEEDLIEQTLPRLAALAAEGVTTVEIKSGYGLDVENELKMLRAIRRLAEQTGPLPNPPPHAREGTRWFSSPPLRSGGGLGGGEAGFTQRVMSTFLGAHAIPQDVDRTVYMNSVVDEMLPAVDRERLADSVDIFIESIGFTLEEARRLFDRARAFGIPVRAHAEQLSLMGASTLAAEYGALSCDHLEYLDEAGIAALARAGTVAVLLPGAFYFLRETKLPPTVLMRQYKIPLAIATDLNPGTSPVPSLLTCLHMAVTLFRLTPQEALLGVTYNAARALGREDLGALTPGRRADFTVWDIPDPGFLAYQLGGVKPKAIFVDGIRRDGGA